MSNQITMKKILLYSAIVMLFAITACHKKSSTPTPVVAVDSVSYNVQRISGDTISTYTSTKIGTFSLNIQVYDQNKNVIQNPDQIKVSFTCLDHFDTIKYNGTALTSATIYPGASNSAAIYEYTVVPTVVMGNQRIVISVTGANGKVFTDTVTFYVKTYQNIPYSVSFNSLSWPSQATTSNFTFSMTLNTNSNTMGYWYEITNFIANPASYTGTTLLTDLYHNSPVYYNSPLTLVNGSIDQVKVSLTGMSAGTYKVPIKIYDGNGVTKLDTLSFVVQ
jgi:hypothetical protein